MLMHKRSSKQVKASAQLDILNTVNSIYAPMISQNPPPMFRIPEHVDRPYLRGSSLPICPLCLALDTVRDEPRAQYNTFMKDFYTKIGSEYHLLVQRWLGLAAVMFGKYECPECKKLYPEGSSKDDNTGIFGPCLCSCKGTPIPCDYIEFHPMGVPDCGGYRGHTDGVLFLNNKYIVLEIKTTSASKVSMRRNHGPDPKHELQAQSYRYVLPKFLDIPESKWHDFVLVWYFDRADPRNHVPLCVPYDTNAFGYEIESFVKTMKRIRKKAYHRIIGKCRNQNDDRYCAYNPLCFSPQRDSLIDAILPGYIEKKRRHNADK